MSDATHIATEARAALARRARLPWWLLALQGLSLLGLLAAPAVSRLVSWSGTYGAIMWPSVIVLCVGELLLQRRRGVALSRRTLAAYPSTRWSGLSFLVVAVVGAVATNMLTSAGHVTAALAVGVVVTLFAMVLLWRMNTAVRRDIRDGHVVS